MKRWVGFAAVLVALGAAPVAAIDVGIGLAGGGSFPLGQSDNSNGGSVSLRVPVRVIPLLTVEPFVTSTALGKVETQFGGQPYTRDGFEILAWGAMVAVERVGQGSRFPIYPYFGLGGYHLGRGGNSDETYLGYLFGAGYARALTTKLAVHARTGMNIVDVGATARRFFELNVGLTLRFHPGVPEEM